MIVTMCRYFIVFKLYKGKVVCHSKGGSVHLYSHVIMQQQVDAISVTKIRPRWNNLGDIQIPTQCECAQLVYLHQTCQRDKQA